MENLQKKRYSTVAFYFLALVLMAVQVNGKLRGTVKVAADLDNESVIEAAKADEKVASAIAMMGVSSILAIGAASGESVSLLGVKLTGVFAGGFSLLALIFFMFYNDKKVVASIEEGRK